MIKKEYWKVEALRQVIENIRKEDIGMVMTVNELSDKKTKLKLMEEAYAEGIHQGLALAEMIVEEWRKETFGDRMSDKNVPIFWKEDYEKLLKKLEEAKHGK